MPVFVELVPAGAFGCNQAKLSFPQVLKIDNQRGLLFIPGISEIGWRARSCAQIPLPYWVVVANI
jgi:hypothetical protein